MELSQRIATRTVQWSAVHGYTWTMGIVAGTTALLWVLYLHFNAANVALFYLVAVVICAATAGRAPAVLGALASFVALKFFFVEPIFTLTIDDAKDVWQLGSFLTAALVVGAITVHARQQTALAQQQKREIEALYDLSQTISTELDVAPIAALIARTTARLLDAPACALLLNPSSEMHGHAHSYGDHIEMRRYSDTPLPGRERTVGVLRVALPPEQTAFTAAQQHLCDVLAAQAALAIERSNLAHVAARAQALAEADRLKSALLSAVSHDVRTPLAAIIGATDELLAEDVRWTHTATQNFALIIKREATHLYGLVSNMLDLTRIEAGVLHPQRGWYNLTEIIHRVLQRLAGELETHPLELSLPESMPLSPVDYVQIEQVFWNVLLNAARYAPPGSPISVAVRWDDTAIETTVADRGPGVPPEARERIFDKFYRLPQPAETAVPGAGLGLAICKGFVEAHGGQICIRDGTKGGTRVVIRLPLC